MGAFPDDEFLRRLRETEDDEEDLEPLPAALAYVDEVAVHFYKPRWTERSLAERARHFTDYELRELAKLYNRIVEAEHVDLLSEWVLSRLRFEAESKRSTDPIGRGLYTIVMLFVNLGHNGVEPFASKQFKHFHVDSRHPYHGPPAICQATQRDLSEEISRGTLDPAKSYPCLICHAPTDSLKCFTFTRWMVCVIMKFWVWEATYYACPRCMRKVLSRQLLLNIPTANLAWPALLLIYLPRYAATYEPGHSRTLTEPPKAPWYAFKFLRPVGYFFGAFSRHIGTYIVLIVSAICSAAISFDRTHHDPFEFSRIWLAVTIALMILRFMFDLRAEMKNQCAGKRKKETA